MRMRRKKNLEERLEACSGKLITMTGDDRNFKTAVLEKDYLNFSDIFGNNNPVHLEIGCGKGQFAIETARRNPDINILAVEKSANVIVVACESAIREISPNLFFLKGGAEYLTKYIPKGSISRIYLNFSCPFPKKKYANHRLTSKQFLEIYREICSPEAEIHQKTDNRQLFEFSIEQLSDFGYTLKNVSLDLHNSNFEGNIVTEYENKFSSMGYPIYRLEAFLK